MNPLYGHTSRETAYLVPDYPYGRLRCKIWFWLESDPKKGFRFVSQTENPKNGRINAEKKSTYCAIAGSMYLDDKGHCHWTGLGYHSNPTEVMAFITSFPGSDFTALRDMIILQVARHRKAYKMCMSFKGHEKAAGFQLKRQLDDWEACATLLADTMAREEQKAKNEGKG